MHFGKIVKGVAHAKGYSAEELAVLLGRTGREVLALYEQEEWTSGNIKAASMALQYNLGKYLDSTLSFDFMSGSPDNGSGKSEYLISVKYPAGKEQLLKYWLSKMSLVAKAIGLEMKR